MDLTDLRHLYKHAKDHFRLETLPRYQVPQEAEKLAPWKHGERTLGTPENTAYLARMRDTTSAGQRWRVHILDYPLTEYSTFELHGYQANVAAGEDVFIANRAWHPDLSDLHEDFWLYDHSIVVRMVYDDEGRFLYPERRDNDLPHYLEIRELAMLHAVPLTHYLSRYEPDLIQQQSRRTQNATKDLRR